MKNNQQKQIDSFLLGSVPPNAIDIEEAVLGAILIDMSAYDIVRDIIDIPEVFYKDEHRKVYSSILEIEQKGVK